MSEVKVNKISPKQTCTQLTFGDAGDTIIIPANTTTSVAGTLSVTGTLSADTLKNANLSTLITQTNSTTITLGTSGQTIALASGVSAGSGLTYNGAVNWSSTVQATGFTAVSGTGYFCNTTSGAFTVTLPASPSAGAIVAFKDYAQTWNTNNLTIGRNGSNIEGAANNYTASTAGLSITLVYVDSTKGWLVVDSGDDSNITQVPLFTTATGGTITTCGNYKIHTFTTSGCFVVTQLGNAPSVPTGGPNTASYLVVAGGGGGQGGGGGAGGFREGRDIVPSYTASPLVSPTGLTLTQTTYPITVGGGGAIATPGSNSIFSTITSASGGGGDNISGGSGAGSGAPGGSGGTGNTPPVSPSQGNNGGPGVNGQSGAGGGGAGATGSPNNGPNNPGGAGGAGVATSITGSSVTRAGGGGGGANVGLSLTPGAGGPGGGGKGAGFPASPSVAGTANTGGGGGGSGGALAASAGGSGIVVIRYKFQ